VKTQEALQIVKNKIKSTMSRYSNYTSNVGSTSYRSPYLDSSSYSNSNYNYPSYESKFESIISRNPEGTARSRAGKLSKKK
jgi:hypothetical protein